MATLASMTVRLGIDTDQLRAGADRARGILSGLGKAAAGLGVGVPAAAAVAAAVGGIAAAAVSAGAAVKAFQMAAGPQMEAVKNVAELAAAAEEAAAQGGEKAAAAQKAYADSLAQLPPATQATAKALIGLKNDQQAWSDSLASSTMPVYTKGIELLRKLLPLLTPLVKSAAGAVSGFIDDIAKGAEGGGLKRFADSLAAFAGKNLRSFLNSLKNVGVGIAGIIRAFLPMSTQMSGGIEQMTAKFAEWGKSLAGSGGFEKFVALAKQGAETLGGLAAAGLKLLVALGPLIGITTTLALQLATIVNNIPTPVLSALAVAIGTVVAAMKLWALAQTVVAVRNRIWTATQWQLNASMLANPIFLIIVAVIALIAIIVLIATKTTWFQTAWQYTWNFIKTVSLAVWNWLKSAFKATLAFLVAVWTTVSGALTTAWNAVWNAIKSVALAVWQGIKSAISTAINSVRATVERVLNAIKAVWNTVWNWIRGFIQRQINTVRAIITGLSAIPGLVAGYFQRMRDSVAQRVVSLIAFVRSIPGKVKSALGNLGSLLLGAGRSIVQGLINGVTGMIGALRSKFSSITNMIPDWKGPMTVDMKLLTPSGEALMSGLMAGVDKTVPALRSQLQGITSDIPGNVNVGVRTAGAASAKANSNARLVVTVDGSGQDAFKSWVRSMIQADAGGNAQRFFGGSAA
ncbi:hypothetical protein ACIRQP_03390 [Streptomyces sp. NPDC102274]|uniref:phage tail protein n=1 Tax=Streptomyces sp. NPDC102274 TaxID=3366151 RepID=UPI00380C66A4